MDACPSPKPTMSSSIAGGAGLTMALQNPGAFAQMLLLSTQGNEVGTAEHFLGLIIITITN